MSVHGTNSIKSSGVHFRDMTNNHMTLLLTSTVLRKALQYKARKDTLQSYKIY